eukprot:448282_1
MHLFLPDCHSYLLDGLCLVVDLDCTLGVVVHIRAVVFCIHGYIFFDIVDSRHSFVHIIDYNYNIVVVSVCSSHIADVVCTVLPVCYCNNSIDSGYHNRFVAVAPRIVVVLLLGVDQTKDQIHLIESHTISVAH